LWLVGVSAPVRTRIVVVLPDPDGPMIPRIVPAGTISEMPSTASWSANWTVTSSTTTTSSPVVATDAGAVASDVAGTSAATSGSAPACAESRPAISLLRPNPLRK